VHVVSPTTKDSCGTVANQASVTTGNDGSAQDEASVVVNCPDVKVAKTADPGTVNAGETAAFTIVVSNVGAGVARNVTLDDPLPAGLDWAADDNDCSVSAATLHCSFGDLAANASRTVHVSAPTTAAVCGAVQNTAEASATNEAAADGGNNSDDAQVTVECPDIKVVKTADAGTVSAGDQLGFTITVTNLGPGEAREVEVADVLPADEGLDFSIADQSDAGACTLNEAKTELSCSKPSLVADGSFSVHVVSPTTKDTCGIVSNKATGAAANEPEDALANNSDSASVQVDCPGLSIHKTADDASVSAGDRIGFTVTVANAGPGAAHNIQVSDALPSNSGLDFAIADQSDPGVCSLNGAKTQLSCSKDSLDAGSSFSAHVVSPTTPATCGPVDNTAIVTASNDDGGSDSASVVVACPDVKVAKTADAATINAGETAAFTIVVSNVGSGIARNVSLNDPLPAGISWSEDSLDCSIAAGALNCSFGDLSPEASRTVHLTGATKSADCRTLHNTARGAAANEREADLDNNTDSAAITVECPSLGLTKTPDAPSVKAGQQLGFTVTVANIGRGTAKAVHVSDPLPANGGLAFSIDTAKSDTGCLISAGTLNCSFGDLARGQSKAVHIVSPTSPATCGNVDNTASASSSNGGTVHASSRVTVACPVVDLAITKVDDPDPVLVGDRLTYTIGVRNNGPDTATNVVVTDSLPSDVTFVSASTAQGSCLGAQQVITCQLGTMPAGSSATITVIVEPTATGTITNTAVVSGRETESDTSNNTASADTRVKGRVTPPVCYTLSVRPISLTVGRRTVVRVLVRARGKAAAGVPVALKGAGMDRRARTNSHGVARLTVKPRKAGLIQVRVPNRRSCSTQQIGVAGVFKPRFTG
jgi:uncharacterized repeat protein (TIGR01451 family)